LISCAPRFQPRQQRHFALRRLSLRHLHRPHRRFDPLEPLLDERRVGERQFELHRRGVTRRVDRRLRVRHRLILERAHNVDQRIAPRELRQELRRRPLPATERLARKVDVADIRERELLRVKYLREPVEPSVRHLNHADVRLDARTVRPGLRVALRDGVEYRRLAGALEANDA